MITIFARVVCPPVPTFPYLRKRKQFLKVKIMIANGTLSLAEWIIDDTCLLFFNFSCNNLSDKNGDSRKLIGHRGPVYDVAFIRQGMMAQNLSQLVLSVSEDTTMRVWDTSNGLTRAVYCGHSYPVWCLDVDSLGMSIATGTSLRVFGIKELNNI